MHRRQRLETQLRNPILHHPYPHNLTHYIINREVGYNLSSGIRQFPQDA